VIDVTNGTNVDMRLVTLELSIASGEIHHAHNILPLDSELERVGGVAGSERRARRPQKGDGSEGSGHCGGIL